MLTYYVDIFNENRFLFKKQIQMLLDTQMPSNNFLEMNVHLMLQYGLLVFFLSLISLAFPNYFGLYGSFILTFSPLLLSWFYSVLTFLNIYTNNSMLFINGFKWFYLPGVSQMTFDILIDKLSISYVTLMLSIGVCVLGYTFSYFSYEPHVESLFLFMNLFMISMCILVLGGNLFVLFLGWELIGLTSFFLMNFWSTKMSTLKAAFKAFVFNKISDLGMLIFIMMNLMVVGDFNILTLNNTFMNFCDYKMCFLGVDFSYVEFSAFFLMVSAFMKSAQFGFHMWLPDSMEAPVPASALIHSATLVSAGVFLLLSFSFLMELTTVMIYWTILISSITAALGGIGACFQSDAKSILAYSTMSHCGFLVFLSCCFNLEIVLLYLCVHGFFKALVFMCVGNVIRFSKNYQDFSYMGGFFKYLPFEASMTLIGLMNLGGLPFSFGFFIKHYTLLSMFDLNNIFVKVNLLIGMFSGLVYSFSLYYYVFFDTKKSKKMMYTNASKSTLKSNMYSNTTLASCLAMTFLLLISTSVMAFMYFTFFIKMDYTKQYAQWSFSNRTFFFIANSLENANVLGTFINWFMLSVGMMLLTMKYSYQLYYNLMLDKSFIIMLLFFYMYVMVLLFAYVI